jgi:FkbM family methyltransferase
MIYFFTATVLLCSSIFPIQNNPIELSNKAIHLQEKGLNFMDKTMPNKVKYIKQNEEMYLINFPINSYRPVFTSHQGLFFIDDKTDFIKSHLLSGLGWELNIRDLIKKFSKPGTLNLDIGSHIGTHTIAMSEAVGNTGSVYAFEPNPKIFRELCFNLSLNNIVNVIPLRFALGASHKMIKMKESWAHNEGASFVVEASNEEYDSQMITLDDLNLKNISLIKIDVENEEFNVLTGGINTIINNRPVILIEIQGNSAKANLLKEDMKLNSKIVQKMLIDLDYRLIYLGNEDFLAIPF